MQGLRTLSVCLALVTAPVLARGAGLRTVSEVSALSEADASRGLQVRLEASVTFADPEWGVLFVQDTTGALYVHWRESRLSPGDVVEVKALTAKGHLSPVLVKPAIRVLRSAALPVAAPASVHDMAAGKFDSKWIETSGVVREARSPWNRVAFWLDEGNDSVQVVIPPMQGEVPAQWKDAVVRIRGVCGTRIENGSRAGALLYVSTANDVQIETPSEVLGLGDGAIYPRLQELSRQRFIRRIRVEGVITYRRPGLIWVETSSGPLPAIPENDSPVNAGDRVEVTGFPAETSIGAGLTHAAVHKQQGGASMVRAEAVEPLDVLRRGLHGKLVRLRGRVREQNRSGRSPITLLVENNSVLFDAELAESDGAPISMGVPADVEVELLGIAIQKKRPRGPAQFSLLVRELRVLPPAGFLSREYAIVFGGLFVSAIAAAVVWLGLLRRTVRRQTELIRARLEREAELESEYRRLFERNPAAVVRWLPSGEIFDCNPAFARILGFESRGDLLKRCYWDFEVDQSETMRLRALKPGGAFSSREAALRGPKGTTVWLEQSVCVVETPCGLIYEATGIDVSERRRYREQLREAHDQLEQRVRERTAELEEQMAERYRIEEELLGAKQHAEEMSRAKSAFLANMSHELRTPLNAIIGYVEMLIEDAEGESMAQWADDLHRVRFSARHLLALINDVLDLAKVEAGRTEFHPEVFAVADMVNDVVATIEPMARKTNNKLEANFERGPAAQFADPMKFRQSLLNLLSNACKFTEGGEVKLTVERISEGEAEWVEWAVCDNGIGIPAEHQHKIFQSFSQVDNTSTRKFSGTGLGLAISRRYCQSMGGDITFTSEPGRGSRFVIRMPAASDAEPKA